MKKTFLEALKELPPGTWKTPTLDWKNSDAFELEEQGLVELRVHAGMLEARLYGPDDGILLIAGSSSADKAATAAPDVVTLKAEWDKARTALVTEELCAKAYLKTARDLRAERDAANEALAKAKADADLCAKSWEREIAANNALRARLKKMAEALQPFSNVAYLVEHHAQALECLDLQPAHFHDARSALRGE
jgi:hypothetical protein